MVVQISLVDVLQRLSRKGPSVRSVNKCKITFLF